VFTDAMLTFTERIIRTACAELDTDLVEFNGRTPYPVRRDHTGVCVRTRSHAHTTARRPTSRLLQRRTTVRSSSHTSTDKPGPTPD
jgi:hypothetical protein